MAEIPIAQAIGAAQDLVRLFNNNPQTPAQSHSVFVKTEVGDSGEFVRYLAVSIPPGWTGTKVTIPASHLGVPVKELPWNNV